ncbi:AMP-binding protein [Kitasatospora sp. MMS16-BH015]|uniref:AMP-binding protein n=1 Tax=Kitasatospora sp. MMS16-BH015 TaxID=2018025 RepID=UPI0020C4E5DC|nr:AMP-binding protein [Kitasatospora sp. MMS16-BH015]
MSAEGAVVAVATGSVEVRPAWSLVDVLVATCAAHPARVAVVEGEAAYSYWQLDRLSGEIAAGLAARGVRPGQAVGLLAPRGWWRCAAVLGIWRAGAAVNSLDPAQPAARAARVVELSGTALVLRGPGVAPGGYGVPEVEIGEVLLRGAQLTEEGPLGYVVTTSGSTGDPKCVAVPTVVLADLAEWHCAGWRSAELPRTSHAASVGFDVGYQELVATWVAGAALVVADEEQRRDPFLLAELLHRHGVVRSFLPVTGLHALAVACAATGRRLPALREVVVAGERLVVNAEVRALFATLDAELVNHYGPSETHLVTEHRLSGDPAGWPAHPALGGPAVGAELLREDGGLVRPFAEGEEAELLVAGRCLALGYLGDERLTAERFREVAGWDGVVRRVYATGDRVRLADGLLHFLGRGDDQLKVRGYRVEPGEVEAVLSRLPGVRRAAVVGRSRAGSTTLHGYLVLDPAAAGPDAAALRAACAAELPEYMIPARFLRVAELPLLASGKVARRELDGTGTPIR